MLLPCIPAFPELHQAEDDGSVASKLLGGGAPSCYNNNNNNNNNNNPSFPPSPLLLHASVIDYSCKEPQRESPYQRRLQLKRMKLHHCAEELGSESSSSDYYYASDDSLHSDDLRTLDSYPFPSDSNNSSPSIHRQKPNNNMLRSFPPPLATAAAAAPPVSTIHDASYNNNKDSTPPPMSLIACREDGRFVLRQVNLPCRSLFRAHRQNGCLTLRLLAPESDYSAEGNADDFTHNTTTTTTTAAAAPAAAANKSSRNSNGPPDANVDQSTEPPARQRNANVDIDNDTRGAHRCSSSSVDRPSFPDVFHRIRSDPHSGVIRSTANRRRIINVTATTTAADEDHRSLHLANLNPLLRATSTYQPHYRLVITANDALGALITLRNVRISPACTAHSHRVELGRATRSDSSAAPDGKRFRGQMHHDLADPQLIAGGEDGGGAGDSPSAAAWLLYDNGTAEHIGKTNDKGCQDDGDRKLNGKDCQDAELLTVNDQQQQQQQQQEEELIKIKTCEQQLEAVMGDRLSALRGGGSGGVVVAGSIIRLGPNYSLMCGGSSRQSFNMIKIHCVATRS